MKRNSIIWWIFLLSISFAFSAPAITECSTPSDVNTSNSPSKSLQQPSCNPKGSPEKGARAKRAHHKKILTSQRSQVHYKATACQISKNITPAVSRPIYAHTLGDLKAPLPEIISSEICKLRLTNHLLNSDDLSIHIHDLSQDETLVNIKADQIRNAASLIKPYVMLTVYDLTFQNKLCLSDTVEMQIEKMITISHNESTNSLIRLIGEGNVRRGLERINATIKKYGFRDTYLVESIPEGGKTYRNRTSAYDMSQFFRRIYKRSLVSPYYSQKMIDVLLNNRFHRIETPVIVQDGVPVADKTGYVRGTNGDCGIVFLRSVNRQAADYVVSIIIENPTKPQDGWGKQKTAVIRHLSNLIYSYFRVQRQTAAHITRNLPAKG